MRAFRIPMQPLAILVLATLVGCGSGDGGDAEKAPEASVSADARAVLAAADHVDGADDMVVSKCAGCSLHMNGMKEHALQVGEYEMHFCSDGCRGRFAENTEDEILSMQIPEE